ncbi:HD domain-containing protein [Micromonospora zingiberis]|uniref:5'-deoxynucleotidase n=1 Tax=Micromonospora zingiberis TaxID=2053011 RepID=A0A4R0GLZ0_9ACTN|nr:HD domain-containing protein [Micromonospora zingiberis]TCB96491.1 HD domain-containing protein [Micromonospora zingiberis]
MNAERVLESMAEIHSLTRLPRIGWVLAGVAEPESVSDHCFETAIIAYLLAQQIDEPVDMGKVLAMALFHEIGEVRITDLPRRSSPYVKKFKREAERQASVDILGGVADSVFPLLEEMHDQQTLEARLVEAAEELQIIAAAMYYAKENNGDISEYRRDAEKYDSLGIVPAAQVAEVVRRKLGEYLGDKPYWELGYSRHSGAADNARS